MPTGKQESEEEAEEAEAPFSPDATKTGRRREWKGGKGEGKKEGRKEGKKKGLFHLARTPRGEREAGKRERRQYIFPAVSTHKSDGKGRWHCRQEGKNEGRRRVTRGRRKEKKRV